MFSWLTNLFGTRPSPGRAIVLRRQVRGAYDAAQTSTDNVRHWANADGLSANAANSPAVRKLLRERARYEAQENNSYAKGIVLTLANDCIGTGPRLQVLTEDAEANSRIEKAFMAWAKESHLPEKLRTMRMVKCVDGEAFAQFVTNERLSGPVKLDLRLVESDQIATPFLRLFDENRAIDGIQYDEAGNPTTYFRLKSHPGGMSVGLGLEADELDASQVIHLFRADRPGQGRGVPEITPALPLFAQLRRFTLATIAAAETAAEFAGVMYTDSPAIEDPADVDAMDAVELQKRAMLTLPAGWKMGQVKAEHPSTTYEMFKREILNEIARCLNMPYNVAAGNSASYNYASGRLDHQVYFKAIRVEQAYFACHALDRIFLAWLDEAALIPDLIPDVGLLAELPHAWFWDGNEHVDPQKEANAQATRLSSHTTTLADEYARQGKDWEEQLRQRGRELELMAELGHHVGRRFADRSASQPGWDHE